MHAILNTVAYASNGTSAIWLHFWRQITVPRHQTMSVRLEKMFGEAAASRREILSLTEKVAITTDAWTALTTEAFAYGTETIHFLLTGLCRAQCQRGTLRKTCSANIFRLEIFI